MQTVKCVVVGDSEAQKTSLLVTYTIGRYPSEYVPTVFDQYSARVGIKGQHYVLGLGFLRFLSTVPARLSCTQTHLRNDSHTVQNLAKVKHRPVSPQDGEEVARALGAVKYVECSMFIQEGVQTAFDEAILAALEVPKVKTKRLCVAI